MRAAERIEWWGEHPTLLWSLHPCESLDDLIEPANDNAQRLTLIERHNVPQVGPFFPHARAGRRPSTRQGEAQLAQAQRAEQAGGWGLTSNHWTVTPYLLANGVRLARLVYHGDDVVPEDGVASGGMPGDVNASTSQLHVFFELGDHLGSTSVVLDKATGELVERATFQGYGGAESDYRPGRWANFREDYRFTGKEEDVEVGLQYFGKRFLNPLLGRWVSADPLAIHAPGEADLNVYAYVSGAVLKNVDPLGLQDMTAGDAPMSTEGSAPNASQSSNVVTLPEVEIHGSVPSGGGKDEAASKGPVPLKDDADYVLAGAWNRGVDATADAFESAGTSSAEVRVDEEGEKLVLLTDPRAAEAAEKIRGSKIDTTKGTSEQQELARKSGIIAGFISKVLSIFGLGKGGRVDGPDGLGRATIARDEKLAEIRAGSNRQRNSVSTVVGAHDPENG